jgi:hypothetical protein
MKISVGSRPCGNGKEPHRLSFGRCAPLAVTAILQRRDEGDARVFDLRVLDGRRFVVRHQAQHDQWELVAVYGVAPRQLPTARAHPITPLLLALLAALCRKALVAIKRTVKRRSSIPGDIPSGGAPA